MLTVPLPVYAWLATAVLSTPGGAAWGAEFQSVSHPRRLHILITCVHTMTRGKKDNLDCGTWHPIVQH